MDRLRHLLNILRCPVTKQDLRPLCDDHINRLNQRVFERTLFRLDGTAVDRPIESGFVTRDGGLIYPIEQGIIILLPSLAIAGRDTGPTPSTTFLSANKAAVREFYEQTGWAEQEKTGVFVDAARFEDLRPVSQMYRSKCHLRINRYLAGSGRYLLDVASGPVQYDEYLTYSDRYDYRVCGDISFSALRAARSKLGDKGIYLLCDITCLPLKDDAMDGVVSLHTIYHVPADEQENAFREIHRVLKPGGDAVVVYSWGRHCLLMRAAMLPWRVIRLPLSLRRRIVERSRPSSVARRDLYFHAHGPRWFGQVLAPSMRFETVVWRSVSVPFMRAYIHPQLFGNRLLELVYRLEERFPRLFAKVGCYPIFIIRKEP